MTKLGCIVMQHNTAVAALYKPDRESDLSN